MSKATKTRKRKAYVLLAVLLIVQTCNFFRLNSVEAVNHVFQDSSQQSSHLVVMIPNIPDPVPDKKIRNAMNIENDELISLSMKNSYCNATAQVRLFLSSKNDTRWKIQTLDLNGIPKPIGGDEFYITYHHNTYLSPSRAQLIQRPWHKLQIYKTEIMILTFLHRPWL